VVAFSTIFFSSNFHHSLDQFWSKTCNVFMYLVCIWTFWPKTKNFARQKIWFSNLAGVSVSKQGGGLGVLTSSDSESLKMGLDNWARKKFKSQITGKTIKVPILRCLSIQTSWAKICSDSESPKCIRLGEQFWHCILKMKYMQNLMAN